MGKWIIASWLLACLVVEARAGESQPVPLAPPEAVLASAAQEAASGNLPAAISELQALDSGTIPPAVRRQADLLLGILLLRTGGREEAIPRLERAAAAYPLLADYALWHLAAAYRGSGQRLAAAAALRRLVDQHPTSVLIEGARRELARDWLEAGNLTQAEQAAGQYLAAFPQGPGRAEVWLTLAEVLMRSARAERADEVLRRVWVELPATPESQRAMALLETIPGARPLTPDEQFQRAMTLYQLGRYGPAVQELAPFAAAASPREVQARLHLGMAAFRLRQYSQAAQWLEPLRNDAGPDRWEAVFWLGRSFGRLGDLLRFTEYLTLLVDGTPQTRRAEEALYLLAQAAADEGQVVQARVYLTRLLQEYRKGAWTDAALWLQGWLAYRDGDLDAALAAWNRLLAEEPGSRLRTPALYWQGRALEAAKRPGEAAGIYRMILQAGADQPYYWFRARQRLLRLGGKPAQPVVSVDASPKSIAGVDGLRAKKARALRALGLEEEAVEEYSEQIRAHPEDRRGLAEACQGFLDLQRFDKAVWLAGQILRPLFIQENGRPPIPRFWQCLYPLGYWPLVRDQAVQEGLDPYLVTAVIREESAFSPQALSRAGARGLMQVMPQTAEQVARERRMTLGVAPPLESPEVNIRLGTIHLAELLRENSGNLPLALASYNAGRQQVRRWRERTQYADDEEFTEDIPYAETRGYVKRVLGSYERYATLYGTNRAASPEPRAVNRRP